MWAKFGLYHCLKLNTRRISSHEPEAVSTAAKCSIEQAKEIIASAKIVSALSAKDAKDMPHTHTNTAKQKSQSKKIANLAKAALED